MLPFPHPDDAAYKIWSRLVRWPQEIFKFESVNDKETIYKLILWAFGSDELKTRKKQHGNKFLNEI